MEKAVEDKVQEKIDDGSIAALTITDETLEKKKLTKALQTEITNNTLGLKSLESEVYLNENKIINFCYETLEYRKVSNQCYMNSYKYNYGIINKISLKFYASDISQKTVIIATIDSSTKKVINLIEKTFTNTLIDTLETVILDNLELNIHKDNMLLIYSTNITLLYQKGVNIDSLIYCFNVSDNFNIGDTLNFSSDVGLNNSAISYNVEYVKKNQILMILN